MKTLLLSVLLSFTFFQLSAQCSVQATNFGNNTITTSYNVSGDVSVTINNDNTITLALGDNFRTAPGPDVRAYLVNSEGRSTAQLKELNPNDLDNISFGLISCTRCNPVIPSNGAQVLTVNITDKDITKYDTVFFYCLEFTSFWDLGSFTPFSSNNCSVLSTETISENNISIYPNPTTDKIFISNLESSNTQIRIFNVLGKIVHQQKNNLENGISLSQFPKGIYMLQVVADNKTLSKKLVLE
jgi:hypothetical protein